MPSKETLIAQVLYSFNYPIMQLAIACDAIVKKAEGNEEMKVAELVARRKLQQKKLLSNFPALTDLFGQEHILT